MANSKSAAKRVRVSRKKAEHNRAVRTRVKTAVKAVHQADEAERDAQFRMAVKVLDKAVTKGVLHKNTAARKKARLHASLKTEAR